MTGTTVDRDTTAPSGSTFAQFEAFVADLQHQGRGAQGDFLLIEPTGNDLGGIILDLLCLNGRGGEFHGFYSTATYDAEGSVMSAEFVLSEFWASVLAAAWAEQDNQDAAEPGTVTAYREVYIQPAHQHGEWQRLDSGTDLYLSLDDLATSDETVSAHLSTEDEHWRDHDDDELVEALEGVVGLVHGEPAFLVARRSADGQVDVTGAEPVEATAGPGGELTAAG